ncbi:MAG: hypothetical protein WCK42_07455, partial [Myxococcaceae bacterium]
YTPRSAYNGFQIFSSLSDADKICTAEANQLNPTAAALNTTWKAILGSSTESAYAHLGNKYPKRHVVTLAGQPVSGGIPATATATAKCPTTASFDCMAQWSNQGSITDITQMSIGFWIAANTSPNPTSIYTSGAGTVACSDWTSKAAGDTGGSGSAPLWVAGLNSCANPMALLCIETDS